MKKLTLSLLSLATIMSVQAASADMYSSFKVGYSSTAVVDNSFNSDFIVNDSIPVLSLGLGTTLDKVRVEGELTTRLGWKDGEDEIKTYNVMANAYYDLLTGPVKPFVGAGIGLSMNEYTAPGYEDENHINFGWQVMAGVSYEMTQSLDLELSYRYMQVDNFKTGTAYDMDLASNEFMVGARYKF